MQKSTLKQRSALVSFAVIVFAGTLVAQKQEFQWNIPAPFPKPYVPADNPMNAAKVELGRRLFYDTRMSVNGQQSCASCHRQELAFTDGKAQAIGTTGARHPRGSMSLANVAYNPALTWANPGSHLLEEQALVPMLGTLPIELGLKGNEDRLLSAISADSIYRKLLPSAFPGDDSRVYSMQHVVRALAAFQRTIISLRSPYDRYRYGNEPNAISESAKRGQAFFFSNRGGGCFTCHSGWNFNGEVSYDKDSLPIAAFFNTGLYNITGETSYPRTNTGVHQITNNPDDIGKFRVPTLRNIALTAPYMHDGSVGTLSDVIDHYAAGGRTIASGPNAGIGKDNRLKSAMVHGFDITPAQKQDLIAFLESLTDSTMIRNPALANPWSKR